MAMPMIDDCHSPSFKSKLKSTISCFTCRNDDVDRLGATGFRRSEAAAARSHCSWLKSEDLDKCLGMIGKRGKNNRRRYNSADFRYDFASYALNFDDEVNREDEVPLYRSFASRLPERSPAVSLQPRDELNSWL